MHRHNINTGLCKKVYRLHKHVDMFNNYKIMPMHTIFKYKRLIRTLNNLINSC
jgi:pyruvate/oxaloacetate carboxyltransferase